jgi:hypothetical protein
MRTANFMKVCCVVLLRNLRFFDPRRISHGRAAVGA